MNFSEFLNTRNLNNSCVGTCVWIDSNGKVNGKTPVSKFNGTFDQFMNMLDDVEEEY